MKELNSIIYGFIWKGRDSDYRSGGLRMPHIKTLIDTQALSVLKKIHRGLRQAMETFSFVLS